MYEIRIIGRKKDGDCMYRHFGQASVCTIYTLPKARLLRFPENERVIRGVGWN